MCWRREGRSAVHPKNEPALTIKGAGCLKVRNKLTSPGHPVRSPRSGTRSKRAAGPPNPCVTAAEASNVRPFHPSTEMKPRVCASGEGTGTQRYQLSTLLADEAQKITAGRHVSLSGTKQALRSNSECQESCLAPQTCLRGGKGCQGTASLKDSSVSSRPPGDIGLCIPKPLRQFKALRGTLGHAVLQPNVYRLVGH